MHVRVGVGVLPVGAGTRARIRHLLEDRLVLDCSNTMNVNVVQAVGNNRFTWNERGHGVSVPRLAFTVSTAMSTFTHEVVSDWVRQSCPMRAS